MKGRLINYYSNSGTTSPNAIGSKLKSRHHLNHRSSTSQEKPTPVSSAVVRSRSATTAFSPRQSSAMAKELIATPSRPTTSQTPTSIPRRLAPSPPHPKSFPRSNTGSIDVQRYSSQHQARSQSRRGGKAGVSPTPLPEAAVSMNHWQDMLEADRNFDSLPPSIFQKVQNTATEGRYAASQGRRRHTQTTLPSAIPLDMRMEAENSSTMNLTFCEGAARTTVLTEDPPDIGLSRPAAQYTVDDNILASSDSESDPHIITNACDSRTLRPDSIEEVHIPSGPQQRLIIQEEDYSIFQPTQVVSPSSLVPPRVVYNLPPQMISNRGGGDTLKPSPPLTQGARASHYKDCRQLFKGSRATNQTLQKAPSSWDRDLLFSSDEAAILAETRRILFEGIRLHSRIAAEYDCTTPIREKALDDLKKSLSVIQALPPIDTNAFVVG